MNVLLGIPNYLFEHLDYVWTFILVSVRYGAMMMLMPGIGSGQRMSAVRLPGMLMLSAVSVMGGQIAPQPDDWGITFGSIFSEFIFGLMLGFIPAIAISGVQLGAQLSSTTMGLGAAQLIDPTLGINVPSLGRIIGDIVVVLFMLLGGHHLVLYVASGLGGQIVPGTFLMSENSLQLIIERSGQIFEAGVMLSAPVVVALLLTQFVMGLIFKAVPTVNIFIVSFPLTIGIGLVLSILSLPEILVYMDREYNKLEPAYVILTEDVQKVK